MKNKLKIGPGDIVLAVLGVALFVCLLTVFTPCGSPKEDGSWMTCHWAGRAEAGIACVIACIALIHLFAPASQVKLGLDFALVPVALLFAVLPVNLIKLCGMKNMRCRAVMHPAVIVGAVLVILAAAFDAFMQWRAGRKQ